MADLSETFQASLQERFSGSDSAIGRDLKLNLSRFISEGALDETEGLLVALACAQAAGETRLASAIELELGAREGVGPELVREARESAAIMGMLNVYYRFRHFMTHAERQADYAQAGLRMTALARPALGKERFELLSLAVSAIHGCEMCVTNHEKALRELGVGTDKIHDAVRIAAVMNGIAALN